MKWILILLISILFTYSCTDPEFSAKKITDPNNSPGGISFFTDQRCSEFSVVKPEVDLLFMWDNSGSNLFINDQTKAELSNLINNVSKNFDYRVVLAPLLPTNDGQSSIFLVASDQESLNAYAKSIQVEPALAPTKLSAFATTDLSSRESGLQRVYDIINDNKESATGIFRTGAYTMVVMMSNGDDNSYVSDIGGYPTEYGGLQYASTMRTTYQSLKSSIQSLQFRFFSIVAHSKCISGYQQNVVYKKMSDYMYQESGAGDQSGDSTPDSEDICGMNFSNIFDGINSSINYQVINHVYNYWPIATSAVVPIDASNITVTKNGVNIPNSTTNGFQYVGMKTDQNMREFPAPPPPPETYTGYMIRLYGTAKVTYPECMIVDTQTPAEYFGYVYMANKPYEGSINITIDGRVIPESTTNGWQYIGYQADQNVKILGPANTADPYAPGIPPQNKSGYFLKLYGDAIYTNNSNVQVVYQPSN